MTHKAILFSLVFLSACTSRGDEISEALPSSSLQVKQNENENVKLISGATMIMAENLNAQPRVMLSRKTSADAQGSLQFQFEIDRTGVWKWNQPENDGELEYSWNVEFTSSSRRYRVGYNQFGFSENGLGEGPFDELIADQGQTDLWVLDENDHIWSLAEEVAVEARVNEQGLLVTIPQGPFAAKIIASGVESAKLLVEGIYLDYLEIPIIVKKM